ncbi:hypothetical protein QBC38DRAFT_235618 [Podospora fimiseda]|uniref:B30.2/SPRY domain-containing protein n=1 Tax=Podospora fimiseda TaxID=252190 RepID=A0AAN7BMP2_9PEZI|nr:hypothetical protein QBC38DRAFT_235618 [Podospora fimiseda]
MALADTTNCPQRETTPIPSSSIPQKRALLEEDHSPAISSPLNPDVASKSTTQKVQFQTPEETVTNTMTREKRTKKDSLKKRESKGLAPFESSRSTQAANKAPKESLADMAPLRYKLAPPKPTDFDLARGPIFTSHHETTDPSGNQIEFFETSDHVYNKKSFHYTHCIADPTFPSMFYYRRTDPEPYGAHMSFEDAASHVYFTKSGTHVTTDKGFRMSRANVAVREGKWYWECKVTRGIPKDSSGGSNGHVRIGFARREASLDAPVGFDAYSYGLRDASGQKVHMSRPKDFFPTDESICEGDVIGLEINLPSERLHRKIVSGQYNPAVDVEDSAPNPRDIEYPNIIRDRIPIRFKAHIYFEKIDYQTTKELEELMNPSPVGTGSAGANATATPPNPLHPVPGLRTLPRSYIKVYKNGKLMGTPWTDLLAFLPPASKMGSGTTQGNRDALDDGEVGYYPAVSVFRGGAVEVNFGEDGWWFPPESLTEEGSDVEMGGTEENGRRPVAERYNEQIVEDTVYDIIDEVGFWAIGVGKDRIGGKVLAGEKVMIGGGTGRGGDNDEEIKELVQDD